MMEGPTDALDSITAASEMVDSSHFDEFDFSYESLRDEMSIDGIKSSPFDDQAADVFASQPTSDRQDSIASITVQTSTFGMNQGHRKASIDDSEEASPGSLPNGAHSLDETISDEFGLTNGVNGDASDLGKNKADKSDTAPAWSELKTKAGKERKRLPLACIACRRKKIRCSGEKPACKHCLRSRIPCVYKVAARKAAPRTDYMAMLDKRLKRMEERIIKVVPKAEQDGAAASVTRAVVKPSIPGALSGSKSTAKKRAVDEAFGPDLDQWARTPSRSKMDASNKPSSVLVQEAEEGKLLLEGGDALPPKEIQEHLAEVFFENIYGQAYHILHKPSYMRKLRAGTLPPVLILSVCAIAARFSTHPKLNTNPNFLRGADWASTARDIVMRRYEWPNITILTCLLILGLHEFGTCHGGRSWALGGQAIRMAFALQLHKDLEYDPLRIAGKTQLSFVDREIRRRTMWACFLMDRFNSSGTDRPLFVREETLKIPLPIKEKNFQLDIPGPTETLEGQLLEPNQDESYAADAKNNMGVAAYMIRAIAVWGRIISYLNQGGKELDTLQMWDSESEYSRLIKQAEDLLDDLPDTLQYNADNLHVHDTENMANQFLFLHISIQQNILFMNRFAVSPPTGSLQQDVPKTFITKAGQKAFQAANRVSELLKDAEAHFITAPFTGYCAFLSSTVHIFGIFSGNSTMEATSKRNLTTNVKFLSKMKRFWGMFHWMSENLREQYRTCADAARQGNPAGENATSPIFQYGDWFDRYPHGVSQSDFLDPAAYAKKEKGEDAVLEQKSELHTVEEFFTTLSPQSTEGGPNGIARPGQPNQLKRKSIARKSSTMSRNSESRLEPLQTEFEHHPTGRHPASAAGRLVHSRSFSGPRRDSLGGQTSGPTNFKPLTIPHSASAASYHALSPISPVAVPHAYSAHPHHHHAFFPPDPFGLQLSAHGMSQLDRQLVFGAYGSNMESSLGSMAGWATAGHDHGESSQDASERARIAGTEAALHAFAGGEASSAWFMPFNMEPPEIGADLGVGGMGNLDGFGGMFANGGMPTGGYRGGR